MGVGGGHFSTLLARHQRALYSHLRGDCGGPSVWEQGEAHGFMSWCCQPNSGGPAVHTYPKVCDNTGSTESRKHEI